MAVKQFKRGFNYEDIDLEELNRTEHRAIEDFFEELNDQMSGVVGSGQSGTRKELYNRVWENESVEELLTDTVIEADRLNTPGHTVRNITGHLQSYSNNKNFDLRFDYSCRDGELTVQSVYTDDKAEYELEPGLTDKEELMDNLSETLDSTVLYQDKIIV
ncbi:MAG: hypothetical protein ACI9SF_000168 [Candidatus Nanohaloarchaea archaeon]